MAFAARFLTFRMVAGFVALMAFFAAFVLWRARHAFVAFAARHFAFRLAAGFAFFLGAFAVLHAFAGAVFADALTVLAAALNTFGAA